MPKASRNERRKRQVKRTNTLLKRQLKTVGLEGFKNYIMLCAILAQKGGEITVTAGTLQQAQQDITKLGYTVTPSEVVGELLVRLVVNETALPPVDESEPGLPFADECPDLNNLPDDGHGNMIITPNEETRYVRTDDAEPAIAVDPSPEPVGVLNPL